MIIKESYSFNGQTYMMFQKDGESGYIIFSDTADIDLPLLKSLPTFERIIENVRNVAKILSRKDFYNGLKRDIQEYCNREKNNEIARKKITYIEMKSI